MRPRRIPSFSSAVSPAGRTGKTAVTDERTTHWFLIAIVVGAALGALLPVAHGWRDVGSAALAMLSTLLLRTIKSLVAALLFSMAVVGIVRHGADIKRVGGLVSRSLLVTELPRILTLALGLLTV